MRAQACKSAAALTFFTLALLGLTGVSKGNEFDKYQIESVSTSVSSTQAGAHADFTVAFALAEDETSHEPFALTRDVKVTLPPGIIGNPQGIPRCTALQLGTAPQESECPQDSQVGETEVTLGGANAGHFTEPVFNMVPPGGETVARFGFYAGPFPTILNARIDPRTYGIVASLEGASAAAALIGASTTLWGVPAAESHDLQRVTPEEALNHTGPPGGRKSNLPEAPFMTNPTDCDTVREIKVEATSYQRPEFPVERSAPFPTITGCGKLSFEPTLTVTPTNPEAFAPTGIDAELQIPQDETAKGLATSELKEAVTTLPAGLTINPAAGDGLDACSAEQVGFENPGPSHCPDAAKIGSAEFVVPALEHSLQGSIYQRSPEPGHLFRLWLVSDELGVHVKLPAEIEANPLTGQLRTVFAGIPILGGNPQVPVADLKLHVSGGPRAPLSTPACGTYQSQYELAPWSGKAPVAGDTPMQISSGCGKGGFSPKLSAGTLNPAAAHFSTFTLDLTRSDGEANLLSLDVTLPKGLLAKLAGVGVCPEPATASGDCPASSQVGTVAAATGVGGSPLWIPQPGKASTAVYLAGPYKSAPYSLLVKVPAQAGPFDLGTVITRAGIYVDPETAQATVKSDPLPQILEGVPVTYRDVHVEVNHPDFVVNPTNCNPLALSATAIAIGGAVANLSDGFQATNCSKLAFAPKLVLRLHGGTKRSQHPGLSAVLTQTPGQANISRASVTLPSSEFIDQSHISNPCTRPQFAANACPTKSLLGHAKAVTPLLDAPLEGPIYFLANGGQRPLPDVVADLNGAFHIVLVGKVDSVVKGEVSRIRTTFSTVPDAPVKRVDFNLFGGGKRGLLVNSANLCAHPLRAVLKLAGQNGRAANSEPRVATDCRR